MRYGSETREIISPSFLADALLVTSDVITKPLFAFEGLGDRRSSFNPALMGFVVEMESSDT